ncbi:MAG TPA: hypothetical protein EYP88_04385 [Anaerolineales bacterium]|nr:hypothetical protein [Anaerolineales bacterium]
MMPSKKKSTQPRWRILSILLAGIFLIIGATSVLASGEPPPEEDKLPEGSVFHPTFPLLDENGENVLDSGKAISTMKTCGACHDAEFIEAHSYHANAGLDDMMPAGETPTGRGWDTSPGFFGTWNPIAYRYLSPAGDERADLTTPEWIQLFGSRHPGGGPAVYSQSGVKLTELDYSATSFETNIVDPKTGELVKWDWAESGVVEMNCFLCHTPNPNNDARKAALHEGRFGWANTATLLGSGIVEEVAGEFVWVEDAFNEDKELSADFVTLQNPDDSNCGLCHGLVHDTVKDPLVLDGCSPERWTTITTGQIISSQRMSDSGMNLEDKESLSRSWDAHSERQLKCTDCHYAINNPLYYQEGSATRPEHLLFDPRRLSVGEYLEKPLHQFARGESAQSMVSPSVKDTMRRCADCHSTESTHEWLPYAERHMSVLSCESCHIPKLYSSANQQHDWTVIDINGYAQTECRGAEGDPGVNTLLTGYKPVLLPRQNADGTTRLYPHNLITTWFWVYGEDERPVPLRDLELVYFQNGKYAPEILDAFDTNSDGELDDSELLLDTEAKKALIADRLIALGLENPRIVGEIQPYSIHHDIATAEWATSDCQVCHREDTLLAQEIQLSGYIPIGAEVTFVQGSNVKFSGEIYENDEGAIFYKPAPDAENLYILGADKVKWVDAVGIWSFILVVLGVLAHGGLRIYAAYKNPPHEAKTKKVYMYGVYERFWHWLQTAAIVLLLFTGIIIHNPDSYMLFKFDGVVIAHNVIATILALNAIFSLFYHLASGEIKQYIPEPKGFFTQIITQGSYYLSGIFKGAEHPVEKTPKRKLNPLQQITYDVILNVLLPLQGITGILIWSAHRFPEWTNALGGLPFLAPFHTLIAWFFGTFIVMHVYLTTTGHTPLAGIESMITGWDEVEVHEE